MTTVLTPVGVNLLGYVETPEMGDHPYLIDVDGAPYVPVGDCGVVLGVRLGDSVFAHDADHAAPGVTLVHPDPAARHGLTAFSCLGNEAVVRDGAAAGAVGRVLGKRGEAGRVVVVFGDDVLARLAPGDAVMVRGMGQGAQPPDLQAAGVQLLNTDAGILSRLGVGVGDRVSLGVRTCLPSQVVGNGIGRPADMWDVDLTLTAESLATWTPRLLLGDLVAVEDLDVRHNIGYRRGWVTVGVVVHGGSPLPGHGPGLMPMLCGPRDAFDLRVDAVDHTGVTPDLLGLNP
ncbi:DUF4438 family protein [Nocardioides sp. MAHUQ-72]|uniref:DUF4438 family protein n=1 Tax=unclassified Nocardioides TaxID=2615069 RepID=UPI003607618A